VTGEKRVVPADLRFLHHLIASCRGKIEMTLAEEDGSEDKLIQSLTGESVRPFSAATPSQVNLETSASSSRAI